MASFAIPAVIDNPEGWGPCQLPEKFSEIPYAPFNKGDRLGKAADWTGRMNDRYGNRGHGQANSGFNYYANEEEDSFKLVDNRVQPRSRHLGSRRFHQHHRSIRREREREKEQLEGTATQNRSQQKKKNIQRYYQRDWDRDNQNRMREASVEVKPDWENIEQINFPALNKLSFNQKTEPEDMVTCGSMEYYNKDFDRITTKFEKRLERFDDRTFYKVTTTDDPVIRHLAAEDAANVFATDAILAALAASPRSVYSWDVVVQRVGSKLFFDKRDNSSFDLLTVNETAHDMPVDDKDAINSIDSLSQEATFINQNFSQQVLQRGGEKKSFDEENPFLSSGEEGASVGYRYRKFKIGEGITLVSRCEVDAVAKTKTAEGEKDSFLTVRALNEYDPKVTGVDWRQKLDTQRGAVLATELKNNSNKLARWTVQAMLAGSEQIKIGYVSRVHPKDSFNHVILGTQFYKPKEFASQINLNVNNMWGILKSYIEICQKLPEGKYVLLKDPNKPTINLYKVPLDTFEEEEEEEEGEFNAGEVIEDKDEADDE